MYDYNFRNEHGVGVPVSQMPLAEIHACLADGIESFDEVPVDRVIERLKLELEIRALHG